MAFVALYDACVLYPAPVRDLLVQLARADMFRARWTERIHEEWIRSLLTKRPELDEARLRRTADLMNRAVEDCLITDYERLIPAVMLPDEDDRHVVAAAIVGRVDVIVTANLKDFPASIIAPLGIKVQHPDVFIRQVLELDTEAVAAVRACRLRLRNPARSVEDYLSTLAQQGLPETVRFLSDRRGQI